MSVIPPSKTNGDLWQEAFDWAQENVKNAERYSTTETRAKAQEAYMAGMRSAPETFDVPTPHHVQYDKTGWLCSICGGWNRDTWTACSHPHAQKADDQHEATK